MRQKNIANKGFTDKWFFIVGIIVFILFVIIPSLIIYSIYDKFESKVQLLITVYFGLVSGVMASWIVAWIIEYQKYKKQKKATNYDLKSLTLWIDELFKTMGTYVQEKDKVNKDGLSSMDLLQKYFDLIQNEEINNPLDNSFLGIYVYLGQINATLGKLLEGEERVYLLSNFNDLGPFYSFQEAISCLYNNMFNNGNYSYVFIHTSIYDFLSTIIPYCHFIDKKYAK